MAESKVQFNLKNVHYALLTETESGGVVSESWATPVAVKGAVSLTLDAEGEVTPFYADGIKYYVSQSNTGYTGSLEMARIPDAMLQAIWGMELDAKNVIIENVDTQYKEFALLFQIDGDADNQLFCFYKCSATRPSIASTTNTESKEPQTQTIDITAMPLVSSGNVMAKTSATTDSTTLSTWFTSVHTEA